MADAKLIIKPPHMRVRMKPGYWPDLPKMLQTIKDAGYQPILDRTELRVSGRVVKQGDRLALELDKMQSPRTILLTAAKDDQDTVLHLERHLGQPVEVEGAWTVGEEGKEGTLGTLGVTAIHSATGRPGGA